MMLANELDELTSRKIARHERRRLEDQAYIQLGTTVVMEAAAEKQIGFSVIDETEHDRCWPHCDFVFEVTNQSITRWNFDFVYFGDDFDNPLLYLSQHLSCHIFDNPKQDEKTSLVVNSLKAYEYYEKRAGKIAYRGDLSLILIDTEKNKVINEIYLSHYDEGKAQEIYLV